MSQVLVVDDEPHVCALASRALDRVGLPCDTAHDGQEAIERFDVKQHKLVVTDLRMPHLSGHSLAVKLLSRPKPPRVVVVTALNERRVLYDLICRGVQDVFWKPCDFNSLALKLQLLTEREQLQQVKPQASQYDGVSPELAKIEQSLMEFTAVFSDRLANIFEFDEELQDPPKAVTGFIERFAKLDEEKAAQYAIEHPDRRKDVRVACPRLVTAVPVNRDLVLDAEPFKAAIQAVSKSGIRLLHTRAIGSEYLALRWPAMTLLCDHICVVIDVKRCQPRSPFYEIAGRFVLAD